MSSEAEQDRISPRRSPPTVWFGAMARLSRTTTASGPHAHLRALGAPEPEMPPYDASKHEPIEEIDVEPDGERAH
jgi:hypothetical protein